MRVLYLSTGIFNRKYGQQTYEWNFLSTCIKQRPNTYFRVILLNDDAIPSAWNPRSPSVKFALCGNNNRFISKIKFALVSFWYALIERPKIIICGHINLSVLCLLISRLFNLKYIILTYGLDVWDIKNKLKLSALKKAYRIISVSHYTAAKIKKQISPSEKEVIVLPSPIDTLRFMPDRKPAPLLKKYNLDGHKVVLTVARLDCADKDKGYDKVILALPQVIKMIPKIKYLLVGEGDAISGIEKLISDLGLKDYIILTGFIPDEDLASYYNLCDCFAMPSKQEGFGIVFLEALACGKPVIAGNLDGSKEALLGGKLGLLVSPDDINQIAEAIIKILNGDAASHLLDANFLRQSVIGNFGLERFRQRIPEVLSYTNNEI